HGSSRTPTLRYNRSRSVLASLPSLGAGRSVSRTCPAVGPGDADEGDDHTGQAGELRDTELAHPEAVETERLDGEAPDRIEPDVREEKRARVLAQPRPQPRHEQQENGEIPQRLVEKGRMEVLELAEPRRPVSGRDVELPGQVRRPPEGFLVEEVPPAPDRLPDRDAGPRPTEAPQDRQPPSPRQEHAHERPHDEATVDGESPFPHSHDLRRVLSVIIPVEDHFVDTGADQPRENRPLRRTDDVVSGKLLAFRLAMAEPEPDDDRDRHQDAVPAD